MHKVLWNIVNVVKELNEIFHKLYGKILTENQEKALYFCYKQYN